MKATCVTNDHGYESYLTEGQEYEVIDIQDGIFAGDYYIQVMSDKQPERKVTCLLYRFDVTKEQANAYVLEHHREWRTETGSRPVDI